MQSSSPPAAGSLPQRCYCCAHCQLGVSARSRSLLLLPLALREPHPAQLDLTYHPYFPWSCTKDRTVTQRSCNSRSMFSKIFKLSKIWKWTNSDTSRCLPISKFWNVENWEVYNAPYWRSSCTPHQETPKFAILGGAHLSELVSI